MKNRLKTGIYTCRSLWIAARRDSTLFDVIDDTTTTKFAGRACTLHGISLPVVVLVLEFPIILYYLYTSVNDATDVHLII